MCWFLLLWLQKAAQHFPIYVLIYLIPTDIVQKQQNIQTISAPRAKLPSSEDYIFISSSSLALLSLHMGSSSAWKQFAFI